jgi:hypothetical protein
MTELIGVLVTAAVTLVSTLRWPTLRRRVRDHVALLKDMPTEDLAAPLRSLLQREVQELVKRDSRHLDPRQDRLLQGRRVLLTFVVAATAVALMAYGSEADLDLPGWLFFSAWAVLVLGLVALPLLMILFVRERLRGRR